MAFDFVARQVIELVAELVTCSRLGLQRLCRLSLGRSLAFDALIPKCLGPWRVSGVWGCSAYAVWAYNAADF